MPAEMMHTRCIMCNGIGSITDQQNNNRPCWCRSGWNPVGVTLRQLERIIEERDRLLEFVARVAVAPLGDCVNELESETVTAIGKEAGALVKDKGARVEEYRIRKGLKTSPGPIPPA